MKRILLCACLAAGLSQAAVAGQGLNGTWKMQKQECSSGAPLAIFTGGMTGSFDFVATFNGSEMQSNIKMSYKYDKDTADKATKLYDDALALWNSQPDSAEKQAAIAQINAGKAMIAQYVQGISCTQSETTKYTLNGTTFHSGAVTNKTSTCPGDSDDDKSQSDSQVVVKGDTMTVKDAPETKDNGSCPKGDSTVSTFVRVK